MKKIILALVASLWVGQAIAQTATATQPTTLGPIVSAFGGLQFALAPGSISAPGGTMTGYVAGDTITLQCTGVNFTSSPVIGVNTVTTGAVTQGILEMPGITSGAVPSGSISCSQASTSGVGTGYTVTASLGVIASYISFPMLSTGGTTNSNGNLILNLGQGDTGQPLFAGNEATFFGDKAGWAFNGIANQNSAFGHNACGNGGTTLNTGSWTCMGDDAGRNIQGTGGGGTLIGQGAGRNVANRWATWIGFQAGGSGGTNNAGLMTGVGNTGLGYNVGSALTAGSGHLFLGAFAGDAQTNSAQDIVLSATNGSSDICDTSNVNDTFFVCPGAGPVLTISGGGTPSTSAATFAGTLAVTNMGQTSAAQTGTVCFNSGTGLLTYDATLGCLTSSLRFKQDIQSITSKDALNTAMQLEPVSFRKKEEFGGNVDHDVQVGFVAEDVAKIDERLTARGDDGEVRGVRYQQLTAILAGAIKELKSENDNLRACNDNWKCRVFGIR
jgi:hypothetical protein